MTEPSAADRLEASRLKFDRLARYYAPLMHVAFLGQERRLYRSLASALELPPGGTLVELGYGPGTVTPHLRAALDPTVRIIGVDFSAEMIARARRRAERTGLRGVRYVQASALEWQPDRPVDAAVISLALSAFPEPMRCVDRVLGWLRPGGQLLVLDSFLIPGRRFANWLVRAKAPAVGADPEAMHFDALLARLVAPRVRSLFAGAYTLVSGRASG